MPTTSKTGSRWLPLCFAACAAWAGSGAAQAQTTIGVEYEFPLRFIDVTGAAQQSEAVLNGRKEIFEIPTGNGDKLLGDRMLCTVATDTLGKTLLAMTWDRGPASRKQLELVTGVFTDDESEATRKLWTLALEHLHQLLKATSKCGGGVCSIAELRAQLNQPKETWKICPQTGRDEMTEEQIKNIVITDFTKFGPDARFPWSTQVSLGLPLDTLVDDKVAEAKIFAPVMQLSLGYEHVILPFARTAVKSAQGLGKDEQSFHLWNYLTFHVARIVLSTMAVDPGKWAETKLTWKVKEYFAVLFKAPITQWYAYMKTKPGGDKLWAKMSADQYCTPDVIEATRSWFVEGDNRFACKAVWEQYKKLLEQGTDPLQLAQDRNAHILDLYDSGPGNKEKRGVFELRHNEFPAIHEKLLRYDETKRQYTLRTWAVK